MVIERMATDQLAGEVHLIIEAARVLPEYYQRMAEAGASAVINPRGRLVVGMAAVAKGGTGELNVLVEDVPDNIALICAFMDMIEVSSGDLGAIVRGGGAA